MGFWRTTLAAFVGGFGVLVIAGLCRLAWFTFKARFTAYGRHVTRVGMTIEEALKDAERSEKGALGRGTRYPQRVPRQGRPPTGDNATGKLKPRDKIQDAPGAPRSGCYAAPKS